MIAVDHRVRYSAAPERVWEVLTDFEQAPGRLRDVLATRIDPPGAVTAGSVVHETRRMFGKEHTEAMAVVEFDPPRRMVLLASPRGARYRTEFRMEPDGAGTLLSISFRGHGVGLVGGLLQFLFSPITGRAVKKCLTRDMEDLRSAVEATSGHGSGVEGAPDAPDEVS